MLMHFHAYIPSFLYILILNCLVLFCLSPSLSLFLSLVAPWHLNENLLCPETLFVPRHLLLLPPLILLQLISGSMMIKLVRTFRRTSHDEAFIRNSKLFYHTFPILTFPLSSIVRGWESVYSISVICPSVIIHEFYSNMHIFDYSVPHFVIHIRGTHIIVISDIVSEVIHVPRVAHPDYPDCNLLRTVSKDELSSHFCETSSAWGDRQNTLCSGFAKGSSFLNMVMTFVLDPLSYYNSIIEPCAQFLLSLLERLSIDFPFHFILSFIDIYKNTATRNKFIFPSAISRILHHFSVSYPKFPHFTFMYANDTTTVK